MRGEEPLPRSIFSDPRAKVFSGFLDALMHFCWGLVAFSAIGISVLDFLDPLILCDPLTLVDLSILIGTSIFRLFFIFVFSRTTE